MMVFNDLLIDGFISSEKKLFLCCSSITLQDGKSGV